MINCTKKLFYFVIFFGFILSFPKIIFAHPGNTASDGCHYCRTNCDKWGVPWNERHCHNAKPIKKIEVEPVREVPTRVPPTIRPTRVPTKISKPTRVPTRIPTKKPTPTLRLTARPTKIISPTPTIKVNKKTTKQTKPKSNFFSRLFGRK